MNARAIIIERAGAATMLGVILSQFPRYDEAFILRELVELAKGPRPLAIYSLRPCRDRVIHEQAKRLLPQTVYAPFLWSRALWRSHGEYARRSPSAYWGSLGWILSRHWRHPVILLKTLALFPKTVHMARLMQQQGITHVHAGWATFPASSAFIIRRLTGMPYSLSGHAHDVYTANPALAEKARAARFVMTCTEENRKHLVKLLHGRVLPDRPPSGSLTLAISPAMRGSPLPASESLTAPGARRIARSPAQPDAAPRSATPAIIVNYHGVDLERFSPVPKPDETFCRILSVGSLLPCKGFETLIDACRRLKERGVAFHCAIAGGGPLRRRLSRLIARWGLPQHVTLTGYVSQETVIQHYQQAHLFVLPTVSEIHWGIPNVLIEAMATKTAVICCHLPSLGELVVHEESGWVIPERDPRALAEAMHRLWMDADRRARLAQAGYQRVLERFSLEQTGQHLRELFSQQDAEDYKASQNLCAGGTAQGPWPPACAEPDAAGRPGADDAERAARRGRPGCVVTGDSPAWRGRWRASASRKGAGPAGPAREIGMSGSVS